MTEHDNPYASPRSADSPAAPAAKPVETEDCPLSWPQQRRNLILFAACTGMIYLAAPVLYVGITQASLCEKLGADARTSNLPSTLFFAMTAMPAILAWISPKVAALKRNLMLCYLVTAVMLATLAVVLASNAPVQIKLATIVLQGGMSGAAMPAAIALLWEAIGRGSSESKRGLALAMAFGGGPLLAVAGSQVQTRLLGGELLGFRFEGLDGFIALFAAGVPVMLLAAVLSRGFIVPPVKREPSREPAGAVAGLLAGVPCMFIAVALLSFAAEDGREWLRAPGFLFGALAAAAITWHFRGLLTQRVLFWATVVTILVYAGNTIPANMNLYSASALGDSPDKFAGLQNTLRFGFKMAAGAALGWLLTRTNPRLGILATSSLLLAAQIWAIFATGKWYLLAFGIFGAGELIGVYSPNYIVSASRANELRRNAAFATMLMVPAAPAGYLFGAIVDFVRDNKISWGGIPPETLGFKLSFLACAAFIASGIVAALLFLPKRPTRNVETEQVGTEEAEAAELDDGAG
jgi:MFS family permease